MCHLSPLLQLQETLLLASRRGDISTVNALLDDGVSPSCSNDRGDSCLHMGCAGGSVDVVQALLNACANVTSSDCLGRTCLHVVCETGGRAILRAILDSKSAHTRLNIDSLATGSITPLHLCAMLGHDQLARDLLVHGATVDLADAQGMSAVHHAASKGHLDVVNLLGEFDEDMLLLSLRDASGSTALHRAVECGHVKVVRTLLSFTHNPNLRNHAGLNCLDLCMQHLESKNGHRYGTPPFTRDENGVREEMASLLKTYGARHHAVKSDGRSIAFVETEIGSPDINKEERMARLGLRRKRVELPPSNKVVLADKDKDVGMDLEDMWSSTGDMESVERVGGTKSAGESDFVTYLDARSQCYYKYSLKTGESEWMTWEQSQEIGIQSSGVWHK